MPEIPVAAEAGLFRDMVGGLLREPAKAAEDAADHDLPTLTHDVPSEQPASWFPTETATHTELRDAVRNGRDTYWLTRRLLSEGGPHGQAALRILDTYRPSLEFIEGDAAKSGSFHVNNHIQIDLNNGDPAIGLTHEATHVEWSQRGIQARADTMGRDDFIRGQLSEETEAMVRQIYENIHRQGVNPHVNLPDTTLQSVFQNGYNAGARQAEAQAQAYGRVLTPNDRAIAGDLAARQAVYNQFASGKVTGSLFNRPYTDTLGEWWDQVNPGKVKPPGG